MELQFFKGTNPLICQRISFVTGVYAIMTAIPIKKKCFLYYMFPLSLSNFFADLLTKTIIIVWISSYKFFVLYKLIRFDIENVNLHLVKNVAK